MVKTILIPTDFSVKLLKLVREALENNHGKKVNLVMVHRISLSSSITDLLFHSRTKMLESLETQEFKDSCKIILSKYESQIKSFRTEFFIGNSSHAFRNFLEGNKIDEVYRPENYQMKLKHGSSMDILPFLSEKFVDTIDVDLKGHKIVAAPEMDQLADLFFQPANGVKS